MDADEKPAKRKYNYKKKTGRPTKYSQEMADLICKRVATSTLGLTTLCKMHDDMPDKDTVNVWRYEYRDFSAKYAEAKMLQADLLAEECADIADNGQNDWMESLSEEERGEGWKFNGEHYQRSRLRVDTRKWLASKLLPKQYGEQRLIKDLTENNEKLHEEVAKLRAELNAKNKKEY